MGVHTLKRRISVLIILLCVSFVMSGCSVKTYNQARVMVTNLGSTIDKIYKNDKECLEALQQSVIGTSSEAEVNSMIAKLNSIYADLTGIDAGNSKGNGIGLNTNYSGDLANALSDLCPEKDAKALLARSMASAVGSRLRSNASRLKDGKKVSTEKVVVDSNKALAVLEDMYGESASIKVITRGEERQALVSYTYNTSDTVITDVTGVIDGGAVDGLRGHIVPANANASTSEYMSTLGSAFQSIADGSGEYIERTGKNCYELTFGISEYSVVVKTESGGEKTEWYTRLEYPGTGYTIQISVSPGSGGIHKRYEARSSSSIAPYTIFTDGSSGDEGTINNLVQGAIRVLDPAIMDDYKVADIIEAIDKVRSGSTSKKYTEIVDNAFSYINNAGTLVKDRAKAANLNGDKDFVTTEKLPIEVTVSYSTGSSTLTIGYIHVTHLNTKAFAGTLTSSGGNNADYWFRQREGGNSTDSNDAYLMKYPLYAISQLKSEVSKDDDKVHWYTVTGATSMFLNLLDKSVIKDSKTGSAAALGEDGELYGFSTNNCSFDFFYNDYTQVKQNSTGNYVDACEIISWDVEYSYDPVNNQPIVKTTKKKKNVSVKTPKIVIIDYMEGTYLPNLYPEYDEIFAVLGRKIRIKNRAFAGTENSTIGQLVGKDGTLINGGIDISINDICSIKGRGSSYTDSDIDLRKLSFVKSNSGATVNCYENAPTGNQDENGFILDSTKAGAYFCTQIETGYFGKRPKVGANNMNKDFGIAKVDESNSFIETPYVFVMATDYNIIKSDLVNNWVNQPADNSYGSMQWWNEWLIKNKYKYRVNIEDISEALRSIYEYELAREGVIILDLETIAAIQRMYDKDALKAEARWVRTFAFLAGFILILYAMLLPTAWLIDTKIGGDHKVLSRLTFGRMIAVSEAESGFVGTDETEFVGLWSTVTRAFILTAVGLILMTVDVVALFYKILNVLSYIYKTFNKLVFNK